MTKDNEQPMEQREKTGTRSRSTYAQQRFVLPGGDVKDELFKRALSYYIVYLEYTQQRDGRVPERIDAMFKERYGFGLNKE